MRFLGLKSFLPSCLLTHSRLASAASERPGKVALFIALVTTVAGTMLLMAPSVYHRMRWNRGGKTDVITVANRLFLAGTALLALGITAAVYLVSSVLYGVEAAIATTIVTAAGVLMGVVSAPAASRNTGRYPREGMTK